MATAAAPGMGLSREEIDARVNAILNLKRVFDGGDYHMKIMVDNKGGALVVEVYEGKEGDAAAVVPPVEQKEKEKEAQGGEEEEENVREEAGEEAGGGATEGQEETVSNEELLAELDAPTSTDLTTDTIHSNYDAMIDLIQRFKSFPDASFKGSQLDQIYKIMGPINKSTTAINKEFLRKIGRTKGIKIEKNIYKAYILNKLLNRINSYFADYFLHSTGVQKEAPNKAELLDFISSEITARERNGVDTSDYKTTLDEIKSDPRIQSILTELNKQTGNKLADVLAAFKPPTKQRGGKHTPLRQTRKLRRSNK